MEIDRSLRAARAAVFAAACVGVSAAGHVWMSGAALPVWALAAAVAAAGLAGYGLAGRQRGFASIAGLMLLGELGLHVLFSAAQRTVVAEAMTSTPGMSSMPRMAETPGMIMSHPVPASAWLCSGAKAGLGAAGARATSPSMAWMSAHHSAGMIGAHVVAGLLCAGWLRCGEAATFRLLCALVRFSLPLLVLIWPGVPSVPDFSARVPADLDRRVSPGRGLLVHAVVRRGPPSSVCCM